MLNLYNSTLVVSTVCLAHFALSRVAVHFEAIFEGFGNQLPLVSQLILPGSVFYWFAPACTILAAVAERSGRITKSHVGLIGGGLTILDCIVCIFGIYLPIFQLGTVISN